MIGDTDCASLASVAVDRMTKPIKTVKECPHGTLCFWLFMFSISWQIAIY